MHDDDRFYLYFAKICNEQVRSIKCTNMWRDLYVYLFYSERRMEFFSYICECITIFLKM